MASANIRASRGFTLIEVLVSLIILSVGLLGLGLLQSQSLKASYSANHRTIATNLAYEILDEMRTNRRLSYRFSYISPSDFTSLNVHTCDPMPNTGDIVADDISGWECQVGKALPNGSSTITFGNVNVNPGDVQININWQDQRFSAASDQANSFTLQSEL
jgi:type IV pilus assembly protein PilV